MAAIIAAGIIPAGLEMMDQPTTRAVEEFVHAGYDARRRRDPAVRIRRHAGGSRGGDRAHDRGAGRGSGATAIRVSQTRRERLRFWAGRKAAFPAVGPHLARLLLHGRHDPAPQPRPQCCKFIAEMERKYELRCPNVFHAGDGNLHPLILFDANDPAELAPHRSASRPRSSSCASRSAARSPASTASASRRSTRCARSSPRPSSSASAASSARSIRRGCSIPARPCRRCTAAPSTDGCTCAGAPPHPDLPRF